MSEAKTSGLMSWDDPAFNRGSQQRSQIDYLRLKSGNSYKLRLYHHPKHIVRYYNEDNNRSVIVEPTELENCPIKIKYPDMKPKDRYAIIVIDRSDKQVKVLEGPEVIFKAFRNFYKQVHVDPGGAEATDWSIEVTGSGLKTRYEVQSLIKPTPFAEEELALLKKKIGEEGYDLNTLFKPTDPSRVEEIFFADPNADKDSGGYGNKREEKPASKSSDKDLSF